MKLARTVFAREQKTERQDSSGELQRLWEEICRVLNGLVSFGSEQGGTENIDGVWAIVTTPAVANTEFSITHNLGRIPEGWLLVSIDKAAILYKGVTSWTTTLMYLKADQATVAIKVFVI